MSARGVNIHVAALLAGISALTLKYSHLQDETTKKRHGQAKGHQCTHGRGSNVCQQLKM